MPYGIVHKVIDDGFTMWSRSGLVICHLSRRLRKSLEFKIRPNMVLTMDYDDDSDSDGNRDAADAPKKVTWIDIYKKAVLLVVGNQDFLDEAKKAMKGQDIKVFSVLKKKADPRACFVAKSGDIHDRDDFDTSRSKSMTKLWNSIIELNNRDNRSDESHASSNDNVDNSNNKLSATRLNDHQSSNIADRLAYQERSVAELRNLLGIRLEANLNSGLGYITSAITPEAVQQPSILQIPTPPASLLARLDAHEERTRIAEQQINSFNPDVMQRMGMFQVSDRNGIILRTIEQIRNSNGIVISCGQEEYCVRNIIPSSNSAQPASGSSA
jgi:hypothetical protein